MPGPVFEDGESLSGVAEIQFMGKLEQLRGGQETPRVAAAGKTRYNSKAGPGVAEH